MTTLSQRIADARASVAGHAPDDKPTNVWLTVSAEELEGLLNAVDVARKMDHEDSCAVYYDRPDPCTCHRAVLQRTLEALDNSETKP